MGAAAKFKQANLPRQSGEAARVRVLRGPDTGVTFVLTGPTVSVGRGEDNDIILTDLKASRRHFEFLYTPSGWNVRDLGSSNGIQLNGKVTRGAAISTRDTVLLGETLMEFLAQDAGTLMLAAPPRSVEQINSEQLALSERQKQIQGLARIGNFKGFGQATGPTPLAGLGPMPGAKKNNIRPILYGLLGLGGLLLFFGGDQKPATPAKGGAAAEKAAAENTRDLSSYLSNEPLAITKTADMFFRSGFREYKAKNYLRAKLQFETVLQMSPGHVLASRYLNTVEKDIQEEADSHLLAGKHSIQAGKLREARGHYEAILRLLNWNQKDPKFTQAKEQLQKVAEMTAEVPS